jgi:triacylglycerol lipase
MEMLLTARTTSGLDFDAMTTGYRGHNALAFARIARLAYKDSMVVEKAVLNKLEFDYFQSFNSKGTEAHLMADHEKIIVAFCGSNHIQDWMNDLDIDLIGGPLGGKVHEGFARMLHCVWRDLQLSIRDLKTTASHQGRSLSVWFTGHSLGAALATLAVAYLREKDQPVQGLYTFGSPRVGDRQFARNFNLDFGDKTFRIVNKNDIITRLPPRALSYSHVGQLRFFDSAGRLQTDASAWYRFLDSVKVHAGDIFDLDFSGMENHDVGAYVQATFQNRYGRVG